MDLEPESKRQLLHAKATAACEALDQGQLRRSAVLLCDLLTGPEGAFSPGVERSSSIALAECVRSFAEANSIPLLAGGCGVTVGPGPGAGLPGGPWPRGGRSF